MTARSPELSGQVRRDLDDIRDWTVANWGRSQWQTYYRGLGTAFRRITNDPNCGQPVILRILHQRRSFAALKFFQGLEG